MVGATFSGAVRRSSSRSAVRKDADLGYMIGAADRIAWGALAGIVFVVPLMMAGMKESGIAVFWGCSCVMSGAWAVRHLLNPDGGAGFTIASAIGFLAIAGVGIQIVPLPDAVLRLLAPFVDPYLPAWSEGGLLRGRWSQVSMTPELTRSGLILLTGYVLFFNTLLQILRTEKAVDAVLRLVALSAILMSVVALAQLFFGNGKFLWMIEYPFRSASWPAKGTFTNQNHLAHFLALGIGPIVWWWRTSGDNDGRDIKGRVSNRGFGIRRSTESYQQGLAAGLSVVLLAGVLSFSRGGIASISVVSVISLIAIGPERKSLVRLVIPAVLFAAVGLGLFGTEMLESKWERLAEAESLEDICRGRFLLWRSLLEAAPWFWPFGAGVGSHAEVYPTWLMEGIGKRFSHAESGYLQVLIETGLFGLTLLAALIVVVTFWFVRVWKAANERERFRALVIFAGLIASALHSIADFVWYIPACLIHTLILAACLCRLCQISANRKAASPILNVRWPTFWAVVLAIGVVPTSKAASGILLANASAESDWLSYRGIAIEASMAGSDPRGARKAFDERQDAMIHHLKNCLDVSPDDGRAKCELAKLYLRRFESRQSLSENPFSVGEIRGTVVASEFQTPREVAEWLKRAFGNGVVDLYRALELSRSGASTQPLRGDNYLVLSQLGFLLLADEGQHGRLLDQAFRVRPHDPQVLFYLGLRSAENGLIDEATEYWKAAFRRDSKFGELIITGLAPYMPPEEIISRLDMSADGAFLLFRHYGMVSEADKQNAVSAWFSSRFSEFANSRDCTDIGFWTLSVPLLTSCGNHEAVLYCLSQASKGRPEDLNVRKRYGLALLNAQAHDAALKQLEWCRLRNPDDREITDAIVRIGESAARETTDGPK